MASLVELCGSAGVGGQLGPLGRCIFEVEDAKLRRFVKNQPAPGRTALEFKVVGDTLVVQSTKWANLVLDLKGYLADIAEGSGLTAVAIVSGNTPVGWTSGVIAGLKVWRTLVDNRSVELDQRHAVLVLAAFDLNRSAQLGNGVVEPAIRELFRSSGWNLEQTFEDLRILRIVSGTVSPLTIRVRERVVAMPPSLFGNSQVDSADG